MENLAVAILENASNLELMHSRLFAEYLDCSIILHSPEAVNPTNPAYVANPGARGETVHVTFDGVGRYFALIPTDPATHLTAIPAFTGSDFDVSIFGRRDICKTWGSTEAEDIDVLSNDNPKVVSMVAYVRDGKFPTYNFDTKILSVGPVINSLP
jgi:hypothetical protein